jgi:hypothetical protein
MKKCLMSCTWRAKRRSRLQDAPKVPLLPRKIDIAQKMGTARLVKRPLRMKQFLRPTLCASLRSRNAHGHLTTELCASLCRQTLGPTESTSVRTYCKHTVWGIKRLVALITLLLKSPW